MNDALSAQRSALEPAVFDAVLAIRADVDAPELALALPTDHPAWQRDVLSISMRTRAIIAALRPLVVKVLNFWDHRFGAVTVGAKKLSVDSSGCYRVS